MALGTGTDSTDRDMAVKVGNPIIYNMPAPASYGTSNTTFLAADIIGGIIVQDGTGGISVSLPSASSLAALVDTPRIGDCVECLIVNGSGSGAITLTVGTGVTFDTNQLSGSRIISAASSKYVTCRFTNVTAGSQAYVVYS